MSSAWESLKEWTVWATERINERLEKAKWHEQEGRKVLAEEELLIAKALLDLVSGFKRMVLDDDKEDTRTEDQ